MVPSVLGGTNRARLSLGLSVCIFLAFAFTLINAVTFQFSGSKQLGVGDESVKPNITNGHGHDSQAVDIDPSLRESSSQTAVAVADPVAAYYPPGNGTRGNSNLPHDSGLRVAVDTTAPSLRESPSQDAVLDDPYAAHYPPGISTRGNSSLPHISGLQVAFVGDSLTRYMYLSLAAYLRRGRWVDGKDVPNILEEGQFGNWNLFYNFSNSNLQPYEQCDCFRPEGKKTARKGIENRYFVDPVRDNALYFIKKFGAIKASGHWSHDQVHDSKQQPHNISNVYIPPKWSYDWASLITEHISKLTPKPKYLVFNAGLWANDLGDAQVRESIVQALNATNIVGIYKTTTYPDRIVKPANYKVHDPDVCKSMQNRCLDMLWTMNLTGPLHYWDMVHFRPHVYTLMNLQLLNLLKELDLQR